MTKKPQKRDNSYYIERLRVDHPAIHADFLAGKFRTPAEAFVAAGLRKSKTPLDLLRSAWSKATAAERDAFKRMIGCTTSASVSVAPAVVSTAVAAPSVVRTAKGKGHLTPTLAAAVRSIVDRRQLKIGDIMREIGLSPLNASLGRALQRGDLVQDSLITALEAWVAKNTVP